MRIGICGDIHFSKNSSIIMGNGTKFSQRLDNCVQSVNWFEQITKEKGCEVNIYLGDFFNTADLDDQTITAIKDIKWNDLQKYVLVGNHDSSVNDLRFSASKLLENFNITIVSNPMSKFGNQLINPELDSIEQNSIEFIFLPYVTETYRKPLIEYFDRTNQSNVSSRIIFSHNDLKGLQLGPVMTVTGFDLNEIEDNCALFINGHLHNGVKVTPNAINLGILTGQNFGEDADKYEHHIMILDTDTMTYELVENPYAFNFYKREIKSKNDLSKLDKLKNQAVLALKCEESLISALQDKLDENKTKIAAVRTIIFKDQTKSETSADEDLSDLLVDHIEKFIECCKTQIDNTKLLDEELAEVCK